MPKPIGIDLGTTYTCVAFMKTDDIVEVVKNHHGNTITPSVVHFGVGITKVGEDAVAIRGKDPKNTVFQVKRFMGRNADDAEIKKRSYPFEIISSSKGNANIRLTPMADGKKGETKVLCPEQISSDIVRYAKLIAEEGLGQKVTEAVITVPANFTNAQRQATKDAGEIAGLKVLRIVNEPTAAALAYGFEKKNKSQSRTVLVYDLGGGTFDVSIVQMRGTEADVKSTQGLTFLGGEDFDQRIYEEAVSEFKNMGVDIPKDGEFALYQSCERAKRTLSTCDSAEIEAFSSKGERKSFNISRETFEELCQDLFESTIVCVKEAIKESGCTMDSIDDIVLVGGSSRIPRVQQLLQKLFSGKKLKFDIPPDHAVAHGAALLAESLSQSTNLPIRKKEGGGGAVKLADVTPMTLGVAIIYDRMSPLIKKNTRYPTSTTEMYYNVAPTTSLKFNIHEGEKTRASENNKLGFLDISVPERPQGENKMETTFSIDADGILNIHVKDKETGKEAEITVQTSKLSPAERVKMANDAKKRVDDEAVEQAKMEARTAFADAVMRARTKMRQASDSGKKEQLRQLVEGEEKWIASKDPSNADLYEHVKSIREALSRLAI